MSNIYPDDLYEKKSRYADNIAELMEGVENRIFFNAGNASNDVIEYKNYKYSVVSINEGKGFIIAAESVSFIPDTVNEKFVHIAFYDRVSKKSYLASTRSEAHNEWSASHIAHDGDLENRLTDFESRNLGKKVDFYRNEGRSRPLQK